jgi:RNA polymerase sigma factor (sigma-70 family)
MLKSEDQFYIDKVLAGDSSAFAVLVERHKNNVFNICIKILENREEAEEVAQDTFLKVFEKLNTFKKEAKFSTWLFRIAYNMSISQRRKTKVVQLEVDDYFMESYAEDDLVESLNIESIELREAELKSAIARLDNEQQLLLQLYYDKDLSIIEVAKITNLTESNVKVKIHRARKKLFKLMETTTKIHSKTA